MAAAGPAGNLSLAVIAFALIKIGLAVGLFVAPDRVSFEHIVAAPGGDGQTFAGEMLSILLTLNVLLCAFNLIPLPPLDGASVIGNYSSRNTPPSDSVNSVTLPFSRLPDSSLPGRYSPPL